MTASNSAPHSPLLVVGSVGLDSVETASDRRVEVLGGAASYFSVAASFLSPVRLTAVVGTDFPEQHVDVPAQPRRRPGGLERAQGRTFRWAGRYSPDFAQRTTLDTQLNVFQTFRPKLPPQWQDIALRVPGQHRSRAAAGRAEPGGAPALRRLRHHELLDRGQARGAGAAAAPGGPAAAERRGGPPAIGAGEPSGRGAGHPGARSPGGRHQARRRRRPAVPRGGRVRRARLPDRDGRRSHRRGRLLRRRLHGLARARRRHRSRRTSAPP